MDHTRAGDTSGDRASLSRHLTAQFDPLVDRALQLETLIDRFELSSCPSSVQEIETLFELAELRRSIGRFAAAARSVRAR